jgi:hypothetical protein
MAKKEVIVDFHDPKVASAPPDAANQQTNEGEKEGSPDETPQSENTGTAVEKKED